MTLTGHLFLQLTPVIAMIYDQYRLYLFPSKESIRDTLFKLIRLDIYCLLLINLTAHRQEKQSR